MISIVILPSISVVCRRWFRPSVSDSGGSRSDRVHVTRVDSAPSEPWRACVCVFEGPKDVRRSSTSGHSSNAHDINTPAGTVRACGLRIRPVTLSDVIQTFSGEPTRQTSGEIDDGFRVRFTCGCARGRGKGKENTLAQTRDNDERRQRRLTAVKKKKKITSSRGTEWVTAMGGSPVRKVYSYSLTCYVTFSNNAYRNYGPERAQLYDVE